MLTTNTDAHRLPSCTALDFFEGAQQQKQGARVWLLTVSSKNMIV